MRQVVVARVIVHHRREKSFGWVVLALGPFPGFALAASLG